MKASLVIPCFNEGKSIPTLLARCEEIIGDRDIEIVIVDNGSTDDTQNILTPLLLKYSFVSIIYKG